MAERARIISAFVDFFAARAVGNIFDFDEDEYERLRKEHGDLDGYVQGIWTENARVYCSELGIPWIRPFTASKLHYIESRLVNALRTQRYTPGRLTRREWLRKKLNECIDQIVMVISPVLPAMDDKDHIDAVGRSLENEYEVMRQSQQREKAAMLERHRQEEQEWGQRKNINDTDVGNVFKRLDRLKRACMEQLSDLGPALFDPSEAGFRQYISK